MRFLLIVLPFAVLPGVTTANPGKEFTPEALAFYEKEVLPLLKANCYKCHGDGKVKAKLSLATRAAILKGATSARPSSSISPPRAHCCRQ